jgi:hypothetical protein
MTNASRNEDEHTQGEITIEIRFQLNPQVRYLADPLPDFDKIEAFSIPPLPSTPHWVRWSEGVAIHVIGSCVVGVLGFAAGLLFAGHG